MERNHRLYILTVLAAFATAACAKKSDSSSNTAPAAPQVKTAVEPITTAPVKPEEKAKEKTKPLSRSKDGVREILSKMADAKADADQKKRNREFANTIKWVDITGGEDKTILVTVTREHGKVTSPSTLQGQINNEGIANLTGTLNGKLTCITADGTCETSVLELRTGAEQTSAKVLVLIRQAPFNIHTKFANVVSKEEGMQKWVNVAVHTARTTNPAGFREMHLESFEVINGDASGIRLTMTSGEGEQVQFKMNADQISYDKKDISEPVEIITKNSEGLKSSLADAIEVVRMKKNNGDGELALLVTLKKASKTASAERFEISVKRKTRPVDIYLYKP